MSTLPAHCCDTRKVRVSHPRETAPTQCHRPASLRRLAAMLLVVTLYFGLGGCALLRGPGVHDLRLASVDIVRMSDRPEARLRPLYPDAPKTEAMIAFTTATNLLRYSVRYDVTVFARISQCTTHAIDFARLLAGGEAIYDREGEVMFRYDGPATTPPDKEGRYTFHAFLPLERSSPLSIPERTPPWLYPIYDLRRETANVCFRLTGGNYFGGITSNTVRIPAPLIRQALDRAGM